VNHFIWYTIFFYPRNR